VGGKWERGDKSNDKDSLGIFQMRPIAWRQVCHSLHMKPEDFHLLEQDPALSERAARAYLSWIFSNSGKKSWTNTIQYWNAGPHKPSPTYLQKVQKAWNIPQK